MKTSKFTMMMVGGALALGLGLTTTPSAHADSYFVDNAVSDPVYHSGSNDHASMDAWVRRNDRVGFYFSPRNAGPVHRKCRWHGDLDRNGLE